MNNIATVVGHAQWLVTPGYHGTPTTETTMSANERENNNHIKLLETKASAMSAPLCNQLGDDDVVENASFVRIETRDARIPDENE